MHETALLACLVAGWCLMGRVARERCLPTRLAGSVALGSLVATALTNVAMRFPHPESTTTVAALLLCMAGGRAPRPRFPRLRSYEILVLGGALAAAAWFVTLHLLRKPDGDYFIHMANWGLLASGHYPPVNPFMPGLPLVGHVARDVLIAWASASAETPFPALRVLTVLWQLSAVTLLYFGVRRHGGGPPSAVAATALALCATAGGFPDFRSPAWHVVVENNNPLVHACLFLLMLLALKPPGKGLTILTGLALGTYALVYETHFAVLVLALPLAARGTLPAVLLAVALAAVQGGLLTSLLTPSAGPAAATQAVSLQGLKPLTLTSPNGREYPLFSLRFLKAQSLGWWLLPFTLTQVRRNRYARLAVLVGLAAVAIPAVLNLGRFNVEALRLVFLAGLGFAVALGCALGRANPRVLVLAALAVAVTGLPTFRLHYHELWRLHRRPGVFVLDPRSQAVQQAGHPQFTEADFRALLRLRQEGRRGERVAANPAPLAGVPSSLDNVPKFLANVAGLARLGVTGAGTRPDVDTLDQNPFLTGYGYRGTAFWSTLDPDLAGDLQADWLYVLDDNLTEAQRARLESEPRYREVARQEGRRLVRVQKGPDPRPTPPDLEVLAPEGNSMHPGEFRAVVVTLRNGGDREVDLEGAAWAPDLRDANGRIVNEGDRVRTRLPDLTLQPGESAACEAYLVAPPLPGDYLWAGSRLRVTR